MREQSQVLTRQNARNGAAVKAWVTALATEWWFAMLVVCNGSAYYRQLFWDEDAHLSGEELRSRLGLTAIWMEVRAAEQNYHPMAHCALWLQHTVIRATPEPDLEHQ